MQDAFYADNMMDDTPLLHVIRETESFLGDVQPNIVYCHHPFDLNVDHRVVANAVSTALRPIEELTGITLRFFEVPSSTEWNLRKGTDFEPDYFVDIIQLKDKLACFRYMEWK